MLKYWKYVKYVMEHKKNVFIECMNMGKKTSNKEKKRDLFIHAFTHDLSKFLPSEFIPYARYFYGDYPSDAVSNLPFVTRKDKILTENIIKADFEKAWEHHYKHNKHHPEYWIGKNMPCKYINQMICDLKGMSRKFGDTAQEYYLKNYYKWNITRETRFRLEIALDLINDYNAPISECNKESWMTIDELIVDMEKYYKVHGTIANGSVKANINDLLKPACDKYNLDIYDLVATAKK
ncbi:hypothetical protein G8V07_15250 [Clostridium botulinum D/C]|uniref:DUF5662 family protein n=1 Tax=Clostridium botulinum TaxID=1491 RepID=UPI001E2F68DF|nr:DUF5662 family protein [Clostridium botulinum]MCD3321820.1 hypothetical protein [Clostridium botulinum D/C]MCD3325074.1 hypothetical protein [Clostridium botulinum D/C]MCD3327923.1 hypothetical protein [Clostridium botulinum D/C]